MRVRSCGAPGSTYVKVQIDNWQFAIDNDLAVAEGFEPSIAGLTIRCLTNLATPQKTREKGDWETGKGERFLTLFPIPLFPHSALGLKAMKGVEPLSSGLQDRRSVIRLSYIAI
jgi:hypothetical protein